MEEADHAQPDDERPGWLRNAIGACLCGGRWDQRQFRWFFKGGEGIALLEGRVDKRTVGRRNRRRGEDPDGQGGEGGAAEDGRFHVWL